MSCKTTFSLLALLITVTTSLPNAAMAQVESPVLDNIRATKAIRLGIREGAKPFSSFPEGSKTPVGYSVDICLAVVEHIRKELRMKDLAVTYVPVSSTTRMSKIKAREIDMECGITVNTESRQKDADFSYAFFISGQQVLSRKSAKITDLNSLNAKSVAITKGTTAEKLFPQLRDTNLNLMRLVTFASNQEAFAALESGKVDAFATIDVVLETLRLQSATPDAYVLSKESLSVEPNAIMLQLGDPEFKKLVNAGLRKYYSSPAVQATYSRWFLANGFSIPMSRMLRESINSPSGNAGVAMILGYSL
jgi:glutamate/aspartate transport system substrate-binding protein